MDSTMASSPPPQGYLSPRSKVARMLADIDEAPTPSPNDQDERQLRTSRLSENNSLVHEVSSDDEDKDGNESSFLDQDLSPTRPTGRAARRMFGNTIHDEEDLYSVTPMRPPPKRTSKTPRTQRSEGLFISPGRSQSDSDDDSLPVNPLQGTSRLAELLAAKRAERMEREAKERATEHDATAGLPEHMIEDEQAPVEPDLEKILSDAARPTRKASKKAMLEMERETQRMAREQALAHQIKTKKKFSTSDLFQRFNFRQSTSNSSSAPNSDGPREPLSTPPSSPPTPWDAQKAMVERGALARMQPVREDSLTSLAGLPINDDDEDDELLDIADIIKQSRAAKANATEPALESPSKSSRIRRKVRLLPMDDDAGDLEIIESMPSHLKAFEHVKPISKSGEAHSRAIHTLKHLAHLTHDDSKTRGRKSAGIVVPFATINAQLLTTAKAHARQAQQQRLAELQAKGVVIMSAEDQEREADQIENLLEKARQEAVDIRKKEKAAAKEANLLASDDEDEDTDWRESEGEDDADEEQEYDNDEAEDAVEDAMLDEAADDNDSDVDEDIDVLQDATHQGPDTQYIQRPSNRRVRVIIDDEDEDQNAQHEMPEPAGNTNDDPFAAFGFANDSSQMLMSPTAAFAATMQTPSQITQRMSNRTSLPPPTFDADYEDDSQLVPASQLHDETQEISLDWETQMPETPLVVKPASATTLETPGWEPSQDAGLPSPWTAARRGELLNFTNIAHETQSTVLERVSESPEPQPLKKGRLTRGMREDNKAVSKTKNAFSEMQRLRLESMNASDRAAAEREMKEMMDDQAEESEDEYAGLGGDDSNMIAPENEEDRAMIDESHIEIDEREARDMQKFYAERQRAAEEEATSKLFKDITTGALRRRQGVGWELDEDEDEIAARRRQIKQREEARKRRLLLQDDNVKGLLEAKGDSKGREAFLRTIGDDDDEVAELDIHVTADEPTETPLQEISVNKRQINEIADDDQPRKKRRTHEEGVFSRPASMLQVRESLSFLLDEPTFVTYGPSALNNEQVEIDQGQGDAVEEELGRDNDGGYASDIGTREMLPPPLPTDRLPATQRRTPAKAVIDRLSLRRGSSSTGSTNSGNWSAWSTGAGSISKVPSLLRQATSNLSATSTNSRGVSYNNGANDRGVSISNKSGGSKKSSLAYQSRAQERKAIGERLERKQEENRRKLAEIRRQQDGALGNGGLESGQWE